jgi:hypothetical protein
MCLLVSGTILRDIFVMDYGPCWWRTMVGVVE